MITLSNLKIYFEWNGDIDTYARCHSNQSNFIEDSDWHEIEIILQRILLMKKGLASKEMADMTLQMLHEKTDGSATIEAILNYVNKE
ncbi:MAG: hypothetical protein HQL26_10160 [Candidatus Omnitrophica bacterium]|nr:hypothetical protein [Candidatus Omnitrophota bacterium]